ncbi:uncharacterized protein [Diadema antillarum]|uniref:uncharacterized protein n=1 Tax=Diadema antillarum TaxID=105358 RepID=UPI003A83D3CA
MAINPLFSGPGYSTQLSRTVDSPKHSMAYPAPSKKPRIGGDKMQAETDPFQDFEDSFTADDLEKLDYIESQALSQMPSQGPNVASTSSMSDYDRALEMDDVTHSCNEYGAKTKKHVRSHGFAFKPLASRSPNVPPTSSNRVQHKQPPAMPHQREQQVKQSNVSYVQVPAKIYMGRQSSSQEGVKSSPPFSSSQNRLKKATESRPTGKCPLLQQSNVSVPLRSKNAPQSQGFTVSTQGTSEQVKKQSNSTKEVRYNLSAHVIHQGGESKQLTPPTGCTSSGSPDLPLQSRIGDSAETSYMAQQLEKTKAECQKFKAELDSLKLERFSKDGEIQVLRQNLGKTKAEVSRMKSEKVELEERWRRDQTEKEKELAREAESLKTQLQFKERELAEAQNSYRSLEQRLQAGGSSSSSSSSMAARNPITPPRNGPRFNGSTLPGRTGDQPSPKQDGGFPTKETFMELNPALGSPARSPARVKMRLVEEGRGTTHSPKRALSRSPARSPRVAFCKQRRKESARSASRKDLVPSPKMTLTSSYPNGHLSSAQLIGRLLEQPLSKAYSCHEGTLGSLIKALQAASDYLNPRHPLRDEDKPVQSAPKDQSCNLAMRSISMLLNSSTCTENARTGTTSARVRHLLQHAEKSLTADHSTAIVGVLPLLEEQLTCFIDAVWLSSISVDASTLASTCPGGSGGSDSSPEASREEEEEQLERVRGVAEAALQTLHTLVTHCPPVCTHIIQGDRESTRLGEGDASLMEIDPSAPLIDPTQAPSSSVAHLPNASHHSAVSSPSSSSSSSSSSFIPASLLPSSCQLLKRLVKIVGIPRASGQSSTIQDTALRILLELARKLQEEDAISFADESKPCPPPIRFLELLSSGVLQPHLSTESPMHTRCLVLSLLTTLTKSWLLTQKMCNHSDTCLLLQIYQCVYQGLPGKMGEHEMTKIARMVGVLLANVTSTHEEGAAFLLDTDCQCSEEVVASLVMMLCREFQALDPEVDIDNPRLDAVRQGILPLHALFMDPHFTDHRLEAEQHFNYLIAEMTRLAGRLPDFPKHEVGFLQDFEGSDEDEWDQDSQEQSTQMDVS